MIPAFAQFSQLAVTDDGRQLYFSSQMVLKGGTTAPPQSRIYRIGPDGVTLFAEKATGVPDANNAFSSADGATAPQVSGDGKVVGASLGSNPREAQLLSPKALELGAGSLQLSRNGRWALVVPEPSASTPPTGATLVDLTTGQSTPVPLPPYGASRAIASGGTVLGQEVSKVAAGPLGLWKQGAFRPIQLPIGVGFRALALSDDAKTLVLSTVSLNPTAFRSSLVEMDLATGRITEFFSTLDNKQLAVFMAVSNDGRRVLYRIGNPQGPDGPAYVADTTTGQSAPISLPDGELVSDGTLNGPGDLAFLTTSTGRIVKITLVSGTVEAIDPGNAVCPQPARIRPGFPDASGSRREWACRPGRPRAATDL